MTDRRDEILDGSDRRHNRQAVLKWIGPDGALVIKRYGVKRGRVRQWLKQIGHWTFAGKSPASPAGRRRTEAACLGLWRRHGFDVFQRVDADLPASVCESGEPFLALEYVNGRTLYALLEDESVSEERKTALLARFSAEWGRRHAAAIRLREPGLLHEHGTFRHVFVSEDGDRMLTFDLEIAWVRRGRVPCLVGREVAAFFRSLGRASGVRRFPSRARVLLDAYPDPALLLDAVRQVHRPPGLFRRLARLAERTHRRADPFAPARVHAWIEQTLTTGHGPG